MSNLRLLEKPIFERKLIRITPFPTAKYSVLGYYSVPTKKKSLKNLKVELL